MAQTYVIIPVELVHSVSYKSLYNFYFSKIEEKMNKSLENYCIVCTFFLACNSARSSLLYGQRIILRFAI